MINYDLNTNYFINTFLFPNSLGPIQVISKKCTQTQSRGTIRQSQKTIHIDTEDKKKLLGKRLK